MEEEQKQKELAFQQNDSFSSSLDSDDLEKKISSRNFVRLFSSFSKITIKLAH